MKLPKMKITQMTSPRSGRAVANQIVVDVDGHRYFQSYETLIAVILPNGNVVLDESKWDYSNTTGVYRNQFLGEKIAETRMKIKSGVYILADLN